MAPRRVAPSALIRDIRFEDTAEAARVVIDLEGRVEPRAAEDRDGVAMLDLAPARLGEGLSRTLDLSEFHGPLHRVSAFLRPDASDTVRLTAEKGAGVAARVEGGHQSENRTRLVWVFPKPAAEAAGRAESFAPTRVGAFSQAATLAETQAAEPRTRGKHFTGRRIDVDFKDADIHNLLRLFSEVGQVNIITSDEVAGRVTIRMRNVPWDQALDVVLRAKSLGQVREGNLIRVAQIAALEKEREAEIARLKQSVELKELKTRIIPVSYGTAADLMGKAREFLSPRGKINTDERTNVLIARDIEDSLDLIEELVKNLDTQTPQVLIEARIVEASSKFSRSLGIQWGGDLTRNQASGNPTGLIFPSSMIATGAGGGATVPSGVGTSPNFAVDLPSSGTSGALGLQFGSVSGNANLNLRISAAEAAQQTKILAAPRVMTLDNRPARIVQGTSIPYQTVSAQGTQTTFVMAALTLSATPHVTADGAVLLTLNVTNNSPGAVGASGQPSIDSRELNTEMLVRDGDTAVLGGIFRRDTLHSRAGVPGLQDVPILGFFFRNNTESDSRNELLVFVTPRIVNRAQTVGR